MLDQPLNAVRLRIHKVFNGRTVDIQYTHIAQTFEFDTVYYSVLRSHRGKIHFHGAINTNDIDNNGILLKVVIECSLQSANLPTRIFAAPCPWTHLMNGVSVVWTLPLYSRLKSLSLFLSSNMCRVSISILHRIYIKVDHLRLDAIEAMRHTFTHFLMKRELVADVCVHWPLPSDVDKVICVPSIVHVYSKVSLTLTYHCIIWWMHTLSIHHYFYFYLSTSDTQRPDDRILFFLSRDNTIKSLWFLNGALSSDSLKRKTEKMEEKARRIGSTIS